MMKYDAAIFNIDALSYLAENPKPKRISIRLDSFDKYRYEYLKSIGINMHEVFRKAIFDCYNENYHMPIETERALGTTLSPALLKLADYITESERRTSK